MQNCPQYSSTGMRFHPMHPMAMCDQYPVKSCMELGMTVIPQNPWDTQVSSTLLIMTLIQTVTSRT